MSRTKSTRERRDAAWARKGSSRSRRNHDERTSKRRQLEQRIFDLEVQTFRRLCKAVNTPYSADMLNKVSNRDWLGVANAPFPDVTSPTFADDYMIQQVMRKNPRLPIGGDRRTAAAARKSAAIQKFFENEQSCRATNDLAFKTFSDFAKPRTASWAIKPQLLGKLRDNIRRILGPLAKAELDYVESKSRFGPGASFHCSSRNLTANKKLESAIGLTPSLVRFVGCIEPHGWVQTTSGYRIVAGSKATTVSKDALTDRFIAIEPALNMRWQLGIGALIRKRLRTFGLDLKYQADRNRLRTRFAQVTGKATIDLSSASDTVALQLVKALLPAEWYHLLCTFRSPAMEVDGVWVPLEKISSMGNGFTFELETLLFYAMALCFDADPYVFGDDIIVDQNVAPDLIRMLNVFGFSVNGKKTFLAGVFFESCGSDFWHGRNVRPMYFKKDKYNDYTSAVIRMANAVRRYANRRNLGCGCDDRFLPVWLYLIHRCPDARQTAIPEGYGDVGLIRNFDDATPSKLRNGYCGFTARVWTAKPVEIDVSKSLTGMYATLDSVACDPLDRPPQFLSKDWKGRLSPPQYNCGVVSWPSVSNNDTPVRQAIRGRVGESKLQTMPVSHWHELGPWQ